MMSILDFISSSKLIGILGVIAIIIVIVTIVIPFIFKLIGLHKKNKATTAVKNDLMIWRRLSGLARGGSKADEAKSQLAKTKIAIIRDSFKKGLSMFKNNRMGRYSVPWYISVGEPSSGKSFLMNCSDVNMIPSENESVSEDGTGSLPVRFWLGGQAAVIDVSGRAFFDRWFGGDSAEWSEIIRLIKTTRKRKPVSGIILTIPADALIADDEELSRKKATLIAAELQRIVRDLSVYLPCYVVITKMDVVTGFRDYFSFLEENKRRQIFGWDNPKSALGYDKTVFASFWNKTVSTLRKGRNGILLSNAAPSSLDDSSKMTSGNIFMFPEAFNDLYTPLDKYLKIIFGMRKMHGLDNLMLSGVYFTSGKDEGITFNKAFADICGKTIDEAPMTIGQPISKSMFVTDLLVHRIYPETWDSGYTGSAVIRRKLPYYVTAACFLFAAAFWGLSAAIAYNNDKPFVSSYETTYYNNLSDLFRSGSISSSPLFATDDNGAGVLLFNEPMSGNSGVKRMEFFMASYSDIRKKLYAPIGFKTASLLMFGHTDMAYPQRQYLLNRIQTDMAYLPLVSAVEKNFILTEKQPITKEKRTALKELLSIAMVHKKNADIVLDRNKDYDSSNMDAFLTYMFPTMSQDFKTTLETFNPKYDRDASFTSDKVVLNKMYVQSCGAGIRSIINGWLSLENYPKSMYAMQKRLIRDALAMDELYKQYVLFELSNDKPESLEELKADVDNWRELGKKQIEAGNNITEAIMFMKAYDAISFSAVKVLFDKAYLSYMDLMKNDFKLLDKYNQYALEDSGEYGEAFVKIELSYLANVKSQAVRKLEREYSDIKNGNYFKEDNILFQTVTSQEENENSKKTPSKQLESIDNMNYKIMHDLLSFATIPEPDLSMDKPSDFISVWNKNQETVEIHLKNFDDYVKVFASSPFVKTLEPIARKMINKQMDYNHIVIISKAMELYPSSYVNLVSNVATMEIPPFMKDSFTLDESRNSAGAFTFRAEYNPKAADVYIKPFGEIVSRLNEKNSDGSLGYPYEYFSENSAYVSLSRLINDYSTGFIRYWGNYGDSLKPYFNNYRTFHDFVSTAKAFALNSRLYSAYEASAVILMYINDELLPASAAENKEAALNLIEGRKKVLDINFSDECARLLSNWASLPASSSGAYREIRRMSDNVLKSSLLTVSGGADGQQHIPWWDSLIDEGVKLVKSEISDDASKTIATYQNRFSKFPLLADGDNFDALTVEEMQSLAEILLDFGWHTEEKTVDGAKDSQALSIKEPVSLKGIVRNDSDVKEWGTNVLRVLNALVSGPKPLQYTVIIPDADIQARLSENYVGAVPALARYRYADITYSSIKNTGRFSTAAGKGKEIKPLSGSVSMGDMTFRFYAYSDSAVADAEATIKGDWAPIRLYLNSDSQDDAEQGIIYSPIVLKDEMGVEYVFFVGLKFDKKLLPRENWPKSNNWPEFSFIHPVIKEDNENVAEKSIKIFNTRYSFAGY